MYIVSYEANGRGTFVKAADAAAVRAVVGDVGFSPDAEAVHVALTDPRMPLVPARGVHTTLDAVRGWTSGPLPPEVATTPLAEREEAVGRRNAFLKEVRRLLAAGERDGVIDLAQAAAIARTIMMAVLGVGPAGRRGKAQAHAILAHRDQV